MPRVHYVKKSRKAIKGFIKKGEPYYWWKFRRGGKRMSKTPPKPSQLTQSEFWGAIYSLQEENSDAPSMSDVESGIESIKERLEEIKSELEDKQSNLENAFPNGCPSLETITERIDALESVISELDGIDITCAVDDDREDDAADDGRQTRAQEIWDEVTSALDGISCS